MLIRATRVSKYNNFVARDLGFIQQTPIILKLENSALSLETDSI